MLLAFAYIHVCEKAINMLLRSIFYTQIREREKRKSRALNLFSAKQKAREKVANVLVGWGGKKRSRKNLELVSWEERSSFFVAVAFSWFGRERQMTLDVSGDSRGFTL